MTSSSESIGGSKSSSSVAESQCAGGFEDVYVAVWNGGTLVWEVVGYGCYRSSITSNNGPTTPPDEEGQIAIVCCTPVCEGDYLYRWNNFAARWDKAGSIGDCDPECDLLSEPDVSGQPPPDDPHANPAPTITFPKCQFPE